MDELMKLPLISLGFLSKISSFIWLNSIFGIIVYVSS